MGEIEPSLCESAEPRLPGEFPIDKIKAFWLDIGQAVSTRFFVGQDVQTKNRTPDFLVETSTTYTLRYEDSTATVS